ncbi:hypothetical protein Jiend_28880 [Micromonospora endophytica]|nr:hypothetical protein Jiend_28880 [Micromonospora endophytica]
MTSQRAGRPASGVVGRRCRVMSWPVAMMAAARYPSAAMAPQARCGVRVEVAAVIAAKAAEAV